MDFLSIPFNPTAVDFYKIAGVIHYSNWPWDEKYKNSYKDSNTICMAGMEYTPLRNDH